MSNKITFEKSGDWKPYTGPRYTAIVGGARAGVTIYGDYCSVGGSLRSQGRKTRFYAVWARTGDFSRRVGDSSSLKGAQEIARRAIASIGCTIERQADNTFAVLDARGNKVYEAGSFVAVAHKFPAAILSA